MRRDDPFSSGGMLAIIIFIVVLQKYIISRHGYSGVPLKPKDVVVVEYQVGVITSVDNSILYCIFNFIFIVSIEGYFHAVVMFDRHT